MKTKLILAFLVFNVSISFSQVFSKRSNIEPVIESQYLFDDISFTEYSNDTMFVKSKLWILPHHVYEVTTEITEGDKTIPLIKKYNFGKNQSLILYISAYTMKAIGYEWIHPNIKVDQMHYHCSDNLAFLKLKIEKAKDSTNRR